MRYDPWVQRERIWQLAVAVLLALLVAWSFRERWLLLTASPFPLGVDGYFYPIQLRALLEEGALHYPSSPLTLWFMLPFAAATDPITGAKLGAALGGAFIALPVYAVGARVGRSRGAGLVAAAIAATSASSMYLTIEFVKQGIGLTVGVTAMWLMLRALDHPTRPRIGVAIAGLVAALLAHKLAAGVVLLIALPAVMDEARGRAVLRGRRLLYTLAALVGLGVIALVLGLLFPQRFLSPSDAALVADLFTSDAAWDAPALHTPRLTLSFEHDALLAGVAGVAAIICLVRWKPKPYKHGERAAAWVIAVLAIAIAFPWLAVDHPQGLGFRLRVAAFVPLALCASIVAGALLAKVKELHRELALAGVAVLVAIRPHDDRTSGRVLAHPAMVSAVMASARHLPAGKTVIVPERHILFMVAWYTRAEVSLVPARIAVDKRVRLMPLAWIGMGSPLEEALDRARAEPSIAPPIGVHPRHRNGLVLVDERTWEWLLAQLPSRARERWERWPTI